MTSSNHPLVLRSLLFSPGNRPDMLAKSQRAGADAVIYDLEDSVPNDQAVVAREHVANALAAGGPSAIFVRVNHPSTGLMRDDLQGIGIDGVTGVILPKAEGVADVAAVDEVLTALEQAAARPVNSVLLIPLIENCRGLHFAFDIASALPRIAGLAFSSGEEGDFMVDLGGQWSPEGEAFLYPRSKVICETRAAGLDLPLDGVFMDLRDEQAFHVECRLARRMGFVGKMAIHPRQVPVINEIFTPSQEEIDDSRSLLDAFAQAEAEGRAAIRFNGRMVDYANVKRAQRILALADVVDRH